MPLQTFRDEGFSAKTLERPAVKSMMDFIAEHPKEVDYVVVYQIDRMSRNAADFFALLKALATYGIEIRDASAPLESTPANKLIQGMNALMAEFDNSQKSLRITENMKRQAIDGHRMHKAPWGLKNVRDINGRPAVEPVPGIAEKIAAVLTKFSEGTYTKTDLVKLCHQVGLTQSNGKPMSIQYVSKLLVNPLYAGLERSSLTDGQFVESTFEGIIGRDVYSTNQELLQGRHRHVKGEKGKYIKVHPDYPLRGFIRCQDCGSKLSASASTGRGGKKYPRYSCANSKCRAGHIKPDALHALFQQHLEGLTPSKNMLQLMRLVVVRKWNTEMKEVRQARAKLSDQIVELEEQKITAIEKVVSGEITATDKNLLCQKLNDKIARLQRDMSLMDRRLGLKQEAIDYAINYLGSAPRLWADAGIDMKVRYQRMIFPDGLTFDLKNEKFGTAPMSILYRLADNKKDSETGSESSLVVPRGVEPRLTE